MDFPDMLKRMDNRERRHIVSFEVSGIAYPVDIRHIASITPRRKLVPTDSGTVRMLTVAELAMRDGEIIRTDESVERVTDKVSAAEFALEVEA